MATVAFMATSRSGLGHLRRVSCIAGALRRHARVRLRLLTNAEPAGLGPGDLAVFDDVLIRDRADMARAAIDADAIAADTIIVPEIGAFPGRKALILRETATDGLDRFAIPNGSWDTIIVPNPPEIWTPRAPAARRIVHAGWILRAMPERNPTPRGIVVATGGGGTEATRAALYPMLDEVLALTRARTAAPFQLRQALGPRADGDRLAQADTVFDPGCELHRVFAEAELVISTAGYNSVLELAATDTPTLLVAIPRSLDDQAARAAHWGPRLGAVLDPTRPEVAANWLADRIDRPRRREPLELGPDGAEVAAKALMELL